MTNHASRKELEKRIAELEARIQDDGKSLYRLRASRDQYKTLVENSSEGIFVAQDGKIKFANLVTLKNAGYSRDQVTQINFTDFIHPDDRQMVFERHLKRQKGESPPSRYAFRVIPPGGEIQWMELNVVQIEWEGRPATLNFMTDITRRKKTEDDLLASEERFRSTVEKSPVGIAIVNDQFRYVYVNPKFCDMLGFTQEELLGADFTEQLPPESRQQSIERYLQRQKGEKVPDRYPISFTRKSGETGFAEVQIVVYVDSKGCPHSIIQASDITDTLMAERERKHLESQLRQAQKMESVGRLAGGVAHDFNNMLSVIQGQTEIALSLIGKENPLFTNLSEILKACRRSADLTQQLLAFARKQTIAPKVMDLNAWVSGTLKMLQRLIGEDKALVFIPGHDLWAVKMDSAQMDQILANLAVNAHDAISGVGKVIVETRNSSLDEHYCADHPGFIPGDYVMLAMSDNGCGMAKNTLEMIFEPFFTTKEVGKGTGLGLATVYGIVKQNNGFIHVYSEPGVGTTFRIYFPRDTSELPDLLKKEADLPARGGAETILMVEDEPSILSMGMSMLKRLGYTVLTATSPDEAMALAKHHSGTIDLLITDVVMPEMNGKELSEKLHEIRPDLKVLFMSGYTADVIAHRGVLEGGVHFIQKPFSSRELDKKIREILEKP
jgi:PAS domain S-box-containing protein